MKQIKAEIIADSKNEFGNRITTFVLTFPRIILAELNTHRMFSRNSASSRAIPFKKMLKMVEEDPFIPIAWQKDHKGMQGTEYLYNTNGKDVPQDVNAAITEWLEARSSAVKQAKYLNEIGVTKQLCNRLLEPFMWHTAIVTATEFENFFHLRCPQYEVSSPSGEEYYRSKKDLVRSFKNLPEIQKSLSKRSNIEWLQGNKGQGEIHIMALAEAMWDAMNESTPKELKAGEWHIPFGENIDEDQLGKDLDITGLLITNEEVDALINKSKIKIATARCARVSYMNFKGKDDYEADIDLHDSLGIRPYTNSKGIVFSEDAPIHMSPFEHCAKSMSHSEYYGHQLTQGNDDPFDPKGRTYFGISGNFKGFIQYRKMLENV